MARAGIPQVDYRSLRIESYRADPEAVLRGLAGLGLPVFVKPARLGSSVGIARVGGADELPGGARGGVRARPARDRRGGVARPRGRVLGHRQRRPDRLTARGDHARRRRGRLVRLRGEVHAGRDGADRAGADSPSASASGCASWRSRRSSSPAAAGSRGSTSSSTARTCSSTSSTRSPGSRRRACSARCSRRAACRIAELLDRLVRLGIERYRSERAYATRHLRQRCTTGTARAR